MVEGAVVRVVADAVLVEGEEDVDRGVRGAAIAAVPVVLFPARR